MALLRRQWGILSQNGGILDIIGQHRDALGELGYVVTLALSLQRGRGEAIGRDVALLRRQWGGNGAAMGQNGGVLGQNGGVLSKNEEVQGCKLRT